MSTEDDVLHTLKEVADVLEELGVAWAVGGSLASSIHGEPRATNDVDVIAALRLPHVPRLTEALRDRFYLDVPAIERAIIARQSFNLIDELSIVKVDVFIPPPGALGEGQLERRQRQPLPGTGFIFVLAAEDIVLQKLRWFDLGGRVSDRQWRDILAVLRHGPFDMDYLTTTADKAGFAELLSDALHDSRANS